MEPSYVFVKQEAITVTQHGGRPVEIRITIEVKLAEHLWIRGGVRKEEREIDVTAHEEDAAHRVRQELREQQPAAVDDGAPRLAHAPGGGEAPRREAAEDFREGVLGQRHAHRFSSSSQPLDRAGEDDQAARRRVLRSEALGEIAEGFDSAADPAAAPRISEVRQIKHEEVDQAPGWRGI